MLTLICKMNFVLVTCGNLCMNYVQCHQPDLYSVSRMIDSQEDLRCIFLIRLVQSKISQKFDFLKNGQGILENE